MIDKWPGLDLSLVDSLAIAASVHDTDGRFVHMNAAAERASGRTNAEMLGHLFTELLRPEERSKVAEQFRRAVEGEPTDFETVFIDANGTVRTTRAQQLPLRDGDAVVGVLILAFGARGQLEPVGLQPRPRLTPRQQEILDLIASGLSTAAIAKQLTLSTETIRNHLRGLFRQLHVHTRLEAIAAARRLGLLSAPSLDPQPQAEKRGSGVR